MDLRETYNKESESSELTEVEEDFYERARRHIEQLRKERNAIEKQHSEEAQRADSKLSNAKLYLDKIRAARQQKINRAVFTPGKPPKKIIRKLTRSEEEYIHTLLKADKKLRVISVGEDTGESVSEDAKGSRKREGQA
jgi:DNA replication initiation complex subunit (GINS family)